MRTPEEMYGYCEKNNTGLGVNRWLTLQHFKIIAQDLAMDEEVVVCFVGIGEDKRHYACGLTQNRLIIARRKLIGQVSKITLLKNVNDIRKKVNPVLGYLTFFTLQNSFTLRLSAEQANFVYPLILNLLTKKDQQPTVVENRVTEKSSHPIQVADASSPIDGNLANQLRELKQLTDEGILTREEFDTQKKKLLGN